MSLFPEIAPYDEGHLRVSERHTIYHEQVGARGGRCALFLHGGPGVGILPDYRRFFDPHAFRTVLLDQRGAGRSRPHAELAENDTWSIVADLEKLRLHLGIDKWLVMGGSWGSLLALCYAIRHPDSISGLILRGVFLGRPRDMDWIYGGEGTARLFPDKWAEFRLPSVSAGRAALLAGYQELLSSDDSEVATAAARRWAVWSASAMTLKPNPAAVAEIAGDDRVSPVARIECHFAVHDFFLPSPNYVLDHVTSIPPLPCHIVHGRYDAICAIGGAWDLHRAWPGSTLDIVENGGHSPLEPPLAAALTAAASRFARANAKRT